MADRFRFERGVRPVFRTLKGRPVRHCGGFIYTADVQVPFYEARHVTIRFMGTSTVPNVSVDGPATSLHRYDDGTLCFQHPRDPDANRWVFRDGLLDLLDAVVGHLFREAWWRDTGEWLGPEVLHLPTRHKDAA